MRIHPGRNPAFQSDSDTLAISFSVWAGFLLGVSPSNRANLRGCPGMFTKSGDASFLFGGDFLATGAGAGAFLNAERSRGGHGGGTYAL